jgi:hypothetical protein
MPGCTSPIAMYVPYDRKLGIHLQDDSFLDKQPWDFASTPDDHYPLLLHYHPLVIYRHQVIKQADVVMALFLLGTSSRGGEAAQLRLLRPLTTGDLALGLHPEHHRLGDRLPGRGLRVLPLRGPDGPGQHRRQRARRRPHRGDRRHLDDPRLRFRRPARPPRRAVVRPAPAGAVGRACASACRWPTASSRSTSATRRRPTPAGRREPDHPAPEAGTDPPAMSR